MKKKIIQIYQCQIGKNPTNIEVDEIENGIFKLIKILPNENLVESLKDKNPKMYYYLLDYLLRRQKIKDVKKDIKKFKKPNTILE